MSSRCFEQGALAIAEAKNCDQLIKAGYPVEDCIMDPGEQEDLHRMRNAKIRENGCDLGKLVRVPFSPREENWRKIEVPKGTLAAGNKQGYADAKALITSATSCAELARIEYGDQMTREQIATLNALWNIQGRKFCAG